MADFYRRGYLLTVRNLLHSWPPLLYSFYVAHFTLRKYESWAANSSTVQPCLGRDHVQGDVCREN